LRVRIDMREEKGKKKNRKEGKTKEGEGVR
jgi:hypothetical protein